MRITKLDGVFLSFLIIFVYTCLYFLFVKNTGNEVILVSIFFVGMFLHFLRKIEAGTTAELVFFEKATGYFWSDGLCLVPSILPVLHNINIYLLWNLKKSIPVEEKGILDDTEIKHFRDQRLPEYQVKAETSFLVMEARRLFGKFFDWLFSLNKREPELLYQGIGFRIVLLAIILGGANKLYVEKIKDTDSKPEVKKMVEITIQLHIGPMPVFPNEYRFVPTEGDTRYFDYIGEMKYFYYQERYDGRTTRFWVDGQMCAVIPAGKTVIFETSNPPKIAINMEEKVLFIFDKNKRPEKERRILEKLGIEIDKRNESWWYLVDNWENIDPKSAGFSATALKVDKIPPPKTGGLVCF